MDQRWACVYYFIPHIYTKTRTHTAFHPCWSVAPASRNHCSSEPLLFSLQCTVNTSTAKQRSFKDRPPTPLPLESCLENWQALGYCFIISFSIWLYFNAQQVGWKFFFPQSAFCFVMWVPVGVCSVLWDNTVPLKVDHKAASLQLKRQMTNVNHMPKLPRGSDKILTVQWNSIIYHLIKCVQMISPKSLQTWYLGISLSVSLHYRLQPSNPAYLLITGAVTEWFGVIDDNMEALRSGYWQNVNFVILLALLLYYIGHFKINHLFWVNISLRRSIYMRQC